MSDDLKMPKPTCPKIDKAISLLEELREENTQLRYCHDSMKELYDTRPQEDAKDKRIKELEYEIQLYDIAFNLCHRYNGNMQSDYFAQAEQILEEKAKQTPPESEG